MWLYVPTAPIVQSLDDADTLFTPQASNPRSTSGEFRGLQDQKTRAENKFMERVDLVEANVKPTNAQGEPTCASEDHSFMGQKPGGSETLPGWETVKNTIGK